MVESPIELTIDAYDDMATRASKRKLQDEFKNKCSNCGLIHKGKCKIWNIKVGRKQYYHRND